MFYKKNDIAFVLCVSVEKKYVNFDTLFRFSKVLVVGKSGGQNVMIC